jgi:hypothetical protein
LTLNDPKILVTDILDLPNLIYLEIMLKSLKTTEPELCQAILTFNQEFLTVDRVVALRQNLPLPEEVKYC